MRKTDILEKAWRFKRGDISLPFAEPLNDWEKVSLPHDWAIAGPFDGWNEPLLNLNNGLSVSPGNATGALPSGGCGIYVHDFSLPETEAGRIFRLEFDGIMSHSKVYVNGQYAGGRASGYFSFALNITDFLHFGKVSNRIVIRVENPLYSSRWYTGGGIYREVRLVSLEKEHFTYSGVRLESEVLDLVKKTAVLSVSAEGIPKEKLRVSIFRNDRRLISGGAELSLKDIELWSPETPNLYTVEVSTKNDVLRFQYGFRTLAFDPDTGMKLNGYPYKFRGLCMHHDLGVFGSAFHASTMAWRLKKLKSIGCNAIRTSHNPPDPKFLDLCDALGFLIVNEAFDMWITAKTPGDYHREFLAWHERDLRDFLCRDRNHPCVALWSIGNEIPDEIIPEGGQIAAKLVKICHQEDPSRRVTASINHQRTEDSPALHAFADELDVIGWNYQPQLYGLLHERFPCKSQFGLETSAVFSTRGEYCFPVREGDIRRETGYSSAYAVEYASWSNLSENSFEAQKQHPWLLGEFAWCAFDYLGEPVPYTWPSRSSCFGLFDLAGLPKDRAWLYAAQWHVEGTPEVLHILPHWNWKQGDRIPVHVFTSCSTVELFLNGNSLGTYERKTSPRLVWKEVTFLPGILEAIAYDRNGKEIARARRVTAEKPAIIKIVCETESIPRKGKLIFTELFLTDAFGNSIENSNAEMEVEITGGKLIGLDNGDSRSTLPFRKQKVKLFNGHAMLTVHSGRKGTVSIGARCGKLHTNIEINTENSDHE
ncbi:MAG: glycoside hydrolase family 2 TIM barrel-domain containing protein [Lentisphaeria bacterium]